MKLLNKKNCILISAGILIFAAVIFTITFITRSSKNSKSIFAFYNLDEKISSALIQEITDSASKMNFQYEFVTVEKSISESDLKKYDIVFLPGGKTSQMISKNAAEIPAECFTKIPYPLGTDKKLLPVLLDHYGLAIYSVPQKKLSLNTPQTYSELKEFLNTEKQSGILSSPSMCAGKNNDEFFGLISNIALTLLETENYLNLCNSLSQTDGTVIPEALLPVLNEIKDMQRNKILLPNWFDATDSDVIKYFYPERNTGLFYQSLSFQRKVEPLYIQYYERIDFPAYRLSQKNAIIGNAVYAVNLNERPETSEILKALVSEKTQQNLTDLTLLAPVNKNCFAFDTEANDVRFWAASSSNGVLPHIGRAAFSDSEKINKLADKIRDYLRR